MRSYAERRYWTDDEDALLRKLSETLRMTAVAERLGRSKKAIGVRAKLLEIRVRPDAEWSEDDDRQLAFWANLMTIAEIAKRMGRTRNAVKCRASSLEIELTIAREGGSMTLKEVAEKTGYDRKVVQRIGRELGQNWRVLVRKTGGDGRPLMYEITETQFREIVKYICSEEFKTLGELVSANLTGRKRTKEGVWLPKEQKVASRN